MLDERRYQFTDPTKANRIMRQHLKSREVIIQGLYLQISL